MNKNLERFKQFMKQREQAAQAMYVATLLLLLALQHIHILQHSLAQVVMFNKVRMMCCANSIKMRLYSIMVAKHILKFLIWL